MSADPQTAKIDFEFVFGMICPIKAGTYKISPFEIFVDYPDSIEFGNSRHALPIGLTTRF
jgi:hypothetical protein